MNRTVELRGVRFTLPHETLPEHLWPANAGEAVEAKVLEPEALMLGLLGTENFKRFLAMGAEEVIGIDDVPNFLFAIFGAYGFYPEGEALFRGLLGWEGP